MKLEKAKRLHGALEPIKENCKMAAAFCESMQYKLACILSGELPEEELDEVLKTKGQVSKYVNLALNNKECMVQHY